jgi:glucosamine kinase
VDAGATWIRIVARPEDGRVRRLVAPAVTPSDLVRAIRAACQRWRVPSARIGAVVVASRGVWTAPERRRVERDLRAVARRTRAISDAEAAWYGAFRDGAGVLILAGTGSIAVGRTAGGRWQRAGGLGPLLGDEGSAFWIGREWLRARTGGVDFAPARGIVHDRAPVARIAALAPQVLRRARRGNRTAVRIVREGQRSLARLTASLAEALDLPLPVRVSWAGSVLARDAWFRAGLRRAVARAGVRARWITPAEDPATAALRLAESLQGGNHRTPDPPHLRPPRGRARR